jgi:uncharacterized phiE125 gp8 family phage protein
MILNRVTAPPMVMSVVELRDDLLISHAEHDTRLKRCLQRAEAYLDGHSGILGWAMLTQQWTLKLPGFTNVMKLPLGPLQQVDSITYFDSDDVQQTLSTDVYAVLDDPRRPYVKLKTGQSYPATYLRDDAVTITFTVGHTSADDVNPAVKAAISMLAGYFYENTEAATVERTHPVAIGVYDILHPFRVLL